MLTLNGRVLGSAMLFAGLFAVGNVAFATDPVATSGASDEFDLSMSNDQFDAAKKSLRERLSESLPEGVKQQRVLLSYSPSFAGLDSGPHLRLVTRKDTGKAVTASVVSGILGAIGSQPVQTFTKEQLKGHIVPAVDSPLEPLVKRMQSSLERHLATNAQPANSALASLQINDSSYKMVYGALSDSATPYDLTYSLSMITPIYYETKGLFGKKSLSVNTTTVFKCVVPVKSASIAEWRANDMAKIKAYTAEAIEFCANEFDKQVGEALSTANTYAASNAELGAKYTPK